MSFQIDQGDYAGTLIVGVGHKARAGKDTVANHLVNHHGFERTAFASRLKEVARVVFGFNDEQLYGNLKEVPDEKWNDTLRFLGSDGTGSTFHEPLTPRIAMQKIGTESFRDIFHRDIWIAALFLGLEPGKRYVITDVRFHNEAQAILDAGGYLWKVSRFDRGDVATHVSETALDDFEDWHVRIDNNFTIQNLQDRVDETIAWTLDNFEDRVEIRLQTTTCLGCLGQGPHSYDEDCVTLEVRPL